MSLLRFGVLLVVTLGISTVNSQTATSGNVDPDESCRYFGPPIVDAADETTNENAERTLHVNQPWEVSISAGFYGVDFASSAKNTLELDKLVHEYGHLSYVNASGSTTSPISCDFLSGVCSQLYRNNCVSLATITLPPKRKTPSTDDVDLTVPGILQNHGKSNQDLDHYSLMTTALDDFAEQTVLAQVATNFRARLEAKDFENFSTSAEFNEAVFTLFHDKWSGHARIQENGSIFKNRAKIRAAINRFGELVFNELLCLELGKCRLSIVPPRGSHGTEEVLQLVFFNAVVDYFRRPTEPENGTVFRFRVENPQFTASRITKVDRVRELFVGPRQTFDLDLAQASFDRLVQRLVREEGLSECFQHNEDLSKIRNLNIYGISTEFTQRRQLFFECPVGNEIKDVRVDVDFSFGLNLWAPGSIGYLDVRRRTENIRQNSDKNCVRDFCVGDELIFVRDISYQYQGFLGENKVVWFRNRDLTPTWFAVGSSNPTSPLSIVAGSLCNEAAGECALWTEAKPSSVRCGRLEKILSFSVECIPVKIVGLSRVILGSKLGRHKVLEQNHAKLREGYSRIHSHDLWGGMSPIHGASGSRHRGSVFFRQDDVVYTDFSQRKPGSRKSSNTSHFYGRSYNPNLSIYPFEGFLDTTNLGVFLRNHN